MRTKLQVAARRGLTRFVGRYTEMEQLRRALEQAKAGHGQIVGVMGEPGLGKSRLFYEFKLHLAERVSDPRSLFRVARQSVALSPSHRVAQEPTLTSRWRTTSGSGGRR